MADYLHPHLAYCSNEQIFLLEAGEHGTFRVSQVVTLGKIKRSRCMAVCLLLIEGHLYCLVALKAHLLALKRVGHDGEETLI